MSHFLHIINFRISKAISHVREELKGTLTRLDNGVIRIIKSEKVKNTRRRRSKHARHVEGLNPHIYYTRDHMHMGVGEEEGRGVVLGDHYPTLFCLFAHALITAFIRFFCFCRLRCATGEVALLVEINADTIAIDLSFGIAMFSS